MSQFTDTNHANETARKAFQGYKNDRERVEQIEKMIKIGEPIGNDEILWLCRKVEWGITQEESSWFDHS